MQEPTPYTNQDKDLHGRNLLGVLTYLSHTWSLHCSATKLKCAEFKSPFMVVSRTKIYQNIVVGVAPLFIDVACPSFFFTHLKC